MLQAIKNISCSGISSTLPIVETNQCKIEENFEETEDEKNPVETLYVNVDLAFEIVDVEKASFGVIRTYVGYCGGDTKCPTYKAIEDHTQTVVIEFDPKLISFDEILSHFWKNHDPSMNCSRQFMSVIFYHSPTQRKMAEDSLKMESGKRNVRTKILPPKEFYYAEDCHQKYLLQRHPHVLGLMEITPGPVLIKSYVATRLNGYAGGYGVIEAFQKDVDNLCLSPNVGLYIRNLISKKPNRNVES